MKLLGLLTSILFLFIVGCNSGSWDFTVPPVEGDEPAIRITDVVWHENLLGDVHRINVKGQVFNVANSRDYKVSIWVRVSYNWWPKPTLDHPYTSISSGGFWSNQVLTGGKDQDMDAVKVYLVIKGSSWEPGQNSAPPGDIIAQDIIYRPKEAGVDMYGVSHEFIILESVCTEYMDNPISFMD